MALLRLPVLLNGIPKVVISTPHAQDFAFLQQMKTFLFFAATLPNRHGCPPCQPLAVHPNLLPLFVPITKQDRVYGGNIARKRSPAPKSIDRSVKL
jgi:hypothetical protein